ncbi:hypothetical protein [Fibrella aquatica]|jgi:hypothetical protein|uniref:hypothetical protein n=1 Tax=Fibrella aquatica TaxID=3242487 RepID=UPI00352116C0
MMKNNLLVGLISGLFLFGCNSEPAPDPALYDRFHGKYQVVSSISNEAIDVNLDGKTSVDLLQEIPTLIDSDLLILVSNDSGTRLLSDFLIVQAWPEQYFWPDGRNQAWNGEPVAYDHRMTINYAIQGSTRTFSFSPDYMTIIVNPSTNDDQSVHWKRPESVMVEGTNTIRVINKRIIYTSSGTKEVLITTNYKRYTKTT